MVLDSLQPKKEQDRKVYMLRGAKGDGQSQLLPGREYTLRGELARMLVATNKASFEEPSGWPGSYRYPWDRVQPPKPEPTGKQESDKTAK